MISHERALELAAAEIDFSLSASDDADLTEHLAACHSCREIAAGLNRDAAAMSALGHEDAPAGLRDRVLAAAAAGGAAPAAREARALRGSTAHSEPVDRAGAESTAGPARPAPSRPTILRFPERYRRPALLAAAAAVVVAVVGGTLVWRSGPPGTPPVAVTEPTPRPGGSAAPGTSPQPGEPSGAPSDDLVTAYHQVAELAPEQAAGGVVDPKTSFVLASRDGTPASALVERLHVRPAIALTATTEADGRVRLTPNEPLTPGVVYRFDLTDPDGRTLDSWAFQAQQPVRVVGTLPDDGETDVKLDTGIEVTFDQDGIVDAASHMKIEPAVDGRFEQHGRVLSFVPTRLAPATVYTVTITRGVRVETTGEVLEQDVRFRFETARSGSEPVVRSYFRFSTDLFESATSDRPIVGLWWFADWDGEGEEPRPPESAALEIFRFPDRGTAIEAFKALRAIPQWSRWNADQRLPTDRLSRVAGLDARLQETNGTLWTELPEPLSAGWYLIQQPSDERPAQTILQVTDVASYLVVSGTKTLVWANDLAGGGPVDGAVVEAEGAAMGRTDRDGLLVAETPAVLTPDRMTSCETDCEPVITVSAGGRGAFLPGTGPVNPDGKGGDQWFGEDADPSYWLLFHTDRTLYRRTDSINVWGMVRDRTTGTVPDSVTMRLVAQDLGDGVEAAAITLAQATPRLTGAFTGTLALRDVPEGSYAIELVVDGQVVASEYVRVDRILKPAYRIQVTTGRRVYVAGDRVRVTAAATFFEGTPVPGVPLRFGGDLETTRTTDQAGSVTIRTTARWSSDDDRSGPRYANFTVRPARAEEGEIAGAGRDVLVFPSSWILEGDATVRAGRVRMSGSVHQLDRDRVERELAQGSKTWEIDFAGAPVRSRTVRATVTELIPERRQVGTTYDFIEKRVVPMYEYEIRERRVGTRRLTTDARGRFSGSISAPDRAHEYRVDYSIADRDGLVTTASIHASQGFSETSEPWPYLGLTAGGDTSVEVAPGEAIDLTAYEPAATGSPADDRHLFYAAQSGLREAIVRPSARYRTTFPDWGPPNVTYAAVRFTGRAYVVAADFGARFRASERAMTVELTTDRSRYAPGGQVTLSVRTRGVNGRPMPATVVLRAVDEKLYAIGGAASDDPLTELYRPIASGIRATYATHRGPSARFEGGDTGGGGDDEPRDAILFRAVDTGTDGRATVRFRLPSDLTSWHVSASAVGSGLEAGGSSILVPVGRAFFVDASIAPQYLVADQPAIQVRGFGTALEAGDRVTFSVSAPSLGLRATGLRAAAFEAVTVPLPKLTAGRHEITISARTGSGADVRRHTLTRTIEVVASRLTRTRTDYREPSGPTRFEGGTDLTDLLITDAGVGARLPLLLDLASGSTARLERALAADVAASLLAEHFPDTGFGSEAVAFESSTYQREDGGLAIVPYGSSDLEASALAALVAPDRSGGAALQAYLRKIAGDASETRERRNIALAGLAGLGVGVIPEIGDALATPDLTVREQLMLGLGAAALGDVATARSIATTLVGAYGEALGPQARLRLGDDTTASATGTALLAMLMASYGDPVAPRYWAYVEADPSTTVPFELHGAGFAASMLEHAAAAPTSFAYTIDGTRRVVELEAGETFRLRLTSAQLATLSIEPVAGRVGVTSTWREPIRAEAIEPDPDLTIARTVRPSGTIPAGSLVTVDLRVSFGAQAPAGCHRVTEQVPSGLVPVGVLRWWSDPEGQIEMPSGVTYPDEQVGQRVVFCAEHSRSTRSVVLRYVARVITTGTYRWEPAIVESRTSPDHGAIVPRTVVRIR